MSRQHIKRKRTVFIDISSSTMLLNVFSKMIFLLIRCISLHWSTCLYLRLNLTDPANVDRDNLTLALLLFCRLHASAFSTDYGSCWVSSLSLWFSSYLDKRCQYFFTESSSLLRNFNLRSFFLGTNRLFRSQLLSKHATSIKRFWLLHKPGCQGKRAWLLNSLTCVDYRGHAELGLIFT